MLVMYSLFCPLPCLRGVLEFAASVRKGLIILSTSMSSWSARICTLVLVMFSLFCPLPCLRGVLEFVPRVSNVLIICPLPCLRGVFELAPSVSNVLIIFSTSMSSWSARVCR